jgi:TolB protein
MQIKFVFLCSIFIFGNVIFNNQAHAQNSTSTLANTANAAVNQATTPQEIKPEDAFRVDINWQKNSTGIPIQITGLNAKIFEILSNDFARSGKLKAVELTGEYELKNQYEAKNGFYRLLTTLYKQEKKLASIQIDAENQVALAHRISDFVYETLFSKRGIFSTRLSYVVENANNFMLMISDSDGSNAKIALQSKQPIISIAWSPTGKEVAYVSFESKKPVVYIHHLESGRRRIFASYTGNNSAPAWSPDGKQIALALSISGNTQIYKMNTDGSNLIRLTQSEDTIIDTEPQFSPDGQSIYFTSDRGGDAQIYKMPANGEVIEKAKRVTFKGNENTSPRISPDGESLAYISKTNFGHRLYIQNLSNGSALNLSDSSQDENPSFAANGDYVIYASVLNGKNSLIAKPVEGGNAYILTLPYAKVKQPTWGPFMQ